MSAGFYEVSGSEAVVRLQWRRSDLGAGGAAYKEICFDGEKRVVRLVSFSGAARNILYDALDELSLQILSVHEIESLLFCCLVLRHRATGAELSEKLSLKIEALSNADDGLRFLQKIAKTDAAPPGAEDYRESQSREPTWSFYQRQSSEFLLTLSLLRTSRPGAVDLSVMAKPSEEKEVVGSHVMLRSASAPSFDRLIARAFGAGDAEGGGLGVRFIVVTFFLWVIAIPVFSVIYVFSLFSFERKVAPRLAGLRFGRNLLAFGMLIGVFGAMLTSSSPKEVLLVLSSGAVLFPGLVMIGLFIAASRAHREIAPLYFEVNLSDVVSVLAMLFPLASLTSLLLFLSGQMPR